MRNMQTNLSTNRHRGTIRGLHWQVAPYGESKLLRCTRGSVFDVAVDLRPDSPTYRQWQGHILDADARTMVFVPGRLRPRVPGARGRRGGQLPGIHPYMPGSERGIRWDDPTVEIAVAHHRRRDRVRQGSLPGRTSSQETHA